jgi:hypothetical protein
MIYEKLISKIFKSKNGQQDQWLVCQLEHREVADLPLYVAMVHGHASVNAHRYHLLPFK